MGAWRTMVHDPSVIRNAQTNSNFVRCLNKPGAGRFLKVKSMLNKSTIKYIQSLQQKKFRDQHGCFVAEGPKLVSELIEGRSFECEAVFALKNWFEANAGLLSGIQGTRLHEVQDHELERIAAYASPNQVVAVFRKKQETAPLPCEGLCLLLDDIRDPGNLGTIIRTADWFGVSQIICSEETVDMYNPKVVQSTMASLGRVNLYYTDLQSWMGQHDDCRIYAATLDGEAPANLPKNGPVALIIGNESAGVSEELIRASHTKVTIPRVGKAESLNAASATAVLLYAFTVGR